MFQDRLKAARNALKISQKQLAEKLFISQQAYAKYEAGTSSPNPETLFQIAKELNISTDYLLGRDNVPDAPVPSVTGGKWIPVLGYVRAGIPTEAVEDILDYEEISPQMAAKGNFFALKINGDSMEPRICDGDVVIVQEQEDVESGDIAVVIVNGDEATVKKIKKGPEGVMLIPSNPAYEPMYYTNEEIETLPLRIIGKVVELRGKF